MHRNKIRRKALAPALFLVAAVFSFAPHSYGAGLDHDSLQRDLIPATADSETCEQDFYNETDVRAPAPALMFAQFRPAMPPEARQAQIPKRGSALIGTWQEYVLDAINRRWIYIGTYEVAKTQGGYLISPREQREPPDFLPSIGLFDVQFDGLAWTFNSTWGQGNVGNFLLRKLSPTLFQGVVEIGGKEIAKTKWVKVNSPA